MTAITSKTAACDYFPPLPTWAFSYNPVKALNGLLETSKILYNLGIVAKKRAEMNSPQYKLFEKRVYRVSLSTFSVLLFNAYQIHLFQIAKDPQLVNAPSFRNHSAIQSMSQEVKKIAALALEELIECHQRMYIGGWLKQFCGVNLNPSLDKSKYLCVGKDMDQIKQAPEAFEYLTKIAPQGITQNMRKLRERGLECYYRYSPIAQKLADKDCLRIHKFSMEMIRDLLQSFVEGTDRALSLNRAPALYPYNLPEFKPYNKGVEEEQRRRLVKNLSVLPFEKDDELVKEYERVHGELKI